MAVDDCVTLAQGYPPSHLGRIVWAEPSTAMARCIQGEHSGVIPKGVAQEEGGRATRECHQGSCTRGGPAHLEL